MGKREMPAKEHRTQRRPQDSRNLKITEDLGTAGGCKIVENHKGNRRPEKAGRSWRKFTIIRQNPWQEIEEDQELTKNHRETGKKL